MRGYGDEQARPKFGQLSCFASDPSFAGFTYWVAQSGNSGTRLCEAPREALVPTSTSRASTG
jgi:hypothetical protein